MKTKKAVRRLAGAAAAALLSALLAACGPGGGGTGTGPISAFSGFSGSQKSMLSAPTFGPCQVLCVAVDLVLFDDRVELTADCRRFVSTKPLEVDAAGRASLPGTIHVTSPSGVTSAPATLNLEFGTNRPPLLPDVQTHVSVSLLDEHGRDLFGTITLTRGAAAIAADEGCAPR